MDKRTTQVMTEITSSCIDMMQEHGSNWTKPWRDIIAKGQPLSAKKRHYNGINRINLAMYMLKRGYTSPVFGTFKQWQSLGYRLKDAKGKGINVVFFQIVKYKDKKTDEEKTFPTWKVFTVFNSQYVENWKGDFLDDDQDLTQDWSDILDAENLAQLSGATFVNEDANSAYYRPSNDTINMPSKEQFKDASGYYGTLFHELGHWTGAKHRLDRKFGTRFGSNGYAFEELIAELTSAILSGLTKVDAEPRADHAKYLNGWIKCLKDNPDAIQKAASAADKAATFILEAAEQSEAENQKVAS
jgi:antirestriction protein ArdC